MDKNTWPKGERPDATATCVRGSERFYAAVRCIRQQRLSPYITLDLGFRAALDRRTMKTFLAIAALIAAGYNLWIAPQVFRLAKTPKSDPLYEERMAKMKRLNNTGRALALVFFGLVAVSWLIGAWSASD